MLAAYGLIVIVATVSEVMEIRLLDRLLDGLRDRFVSRPTESEWASNDKRQRIVARVHLWVFVATSAVFCAWIHRVSANLVSLGTERQRFSPAWAVIWWFVPVTQLFRPYEVLKEIWRESRPTSSRQESWNLLRWWWTAWITAIVLAPLNWLLNGSGEAEIQIFSGQMAVVRFSSMLAATVMAVMMVRRISALQDEKSKTPTDQIER